MAAALALAVSCEKEPSSSDFDGEYLVYTAHSEDIEDFSGFSSFTVADSLLVIDGDRGSLFLNDWGKTVRNQYISEMEELGYTYVRLHLRGYGHDRQRPRTGGHRRSEG